MEKKKFLFLIMTGIFFTSQAQTAKFGLPEEMEQKRTASLDNVVGVLNNNYLVIENDYGKAADFKNNIRSNVRRYSVSNLGNKGSVYLNPLVGEGVDEDKILFTDIFQWNGRVVGFYTIKGKASKESFPVYARFFDGNLKPLGKKDIDVGEFSHVFGTSAYFEQTGTFLNARNKMAVRDEFKFRISPDSSKLVMLMPAPGKADFNLKCRIFDRDLTLIKEITAVIPIQSKKAELTEFQLGNDGTVFLMTQTLKNKSLRKEEKEDDDFITEIHSISFASGKVQTKSISIVGKSILEPTCTLDVNGKLTIVTMYHDNSKDKDKKAAHGIYAAKADPESLVLSSQDQQDFAADILKTELDEKDINKGKGIKSFDLDKFTRRPDGGIYAMGQWQGTQVVMRGSTGAMNSYITVFGTTIFCLVDASGKIRWSRGFDTYSANKETMTVTAGLLTLFRDNKFTVGFASDNGLKKKELKRGLKFISFDDSGIKTEGKFIPFSEELQDFGIVPATFYKVNDDQYMLCMHQGAERGHKEMETAIVQVKF